MPTSQRFNCRSSHASNSTGHLALPIPSSARACCAETLTACDSAYKELLLTASPCNPPGGLAERINRTY